MTITQTFIPDPLASEHAQAPPSGAHSNLPADEGVWAAARQSYVEGCSTPVVAERHGLNERTVRRRAAAEDWRSLRRARNLAGALRTHRPPPFAGEPMTEEEAFAANPELEPFVAAHTYEVGELLLDPRPDRLARFAFRRAAEAAARGAAAEAGSWMRLIQAVDRTTDRLERLSRPFSGADHLRGIYARQLRDAFEGPEDEADEADGPPKDEPCPDVRDVR